MNTVIIDYQSGNLRSAEKSFERVARENDAGGVTVTSDPDIVRRADRIVLPGVGAFADCQQGLMARDGLWPALSERVMQDGVPFLGICVGMQLMADIGREHGRDAPGFGWVSGEVVAITPIDPGLKVPHMGWNTLSVTQTHPVLAGIEAADHVYFVHSFHLALQDESHLMATAEYGGDITAAVGHDNLFGTQFHPEKSQKTGLRLIANFLDWRP